MEDKQMKTHKDNLTSGVPTQSPAVVLLALFCAASCSVKKPAETAASPAPTVFATPDEAGQALRSAAGARDESGLAKIMGPGSEAILHSGDAAEDQATLESFVAKYDRMNRWVTMTDGSKVLYIGADNYPFPIPLAQDSSSRWYFDASAGDEELRARRIGSNELAAMDACRLIAHAEEIYHHDTHRYTDTINSTPGQQDGLYWEVAEGQVSSPMGRLNQFAKGIFDAGAPSKTAVFNGYSFRILTTQGGFTIFASPVNYQRSGIMTFSVGRDGVVYQQDLGPQATDTLEAIHQYNPTNGWTQAE